ncbi:MAG: DUF1648 domain-containing protein [Bacteroidaceae bacterium]|nr:DUF1648 domain-containing protein [Bacteroidaceae bacterium]
MNKRLWLVPVLIVAINALAIVVCWRCLEEVLPAHFDLDGNPDGTMPRMALLLYPVIEVMVCLTGYLIALKKQRLSCALVVLTSGLCLVLLSSAMVALTYGTMPAFMLAEPVILLATIVGCVFSIVKSREKNR